MAEIIIRTDSGEFPLTIYGVRKQELESGYKRGILWKTIERALGETLAKEVYDDKVREATSLAPEEVEDEV